MKPKLEQPVIDAQGNIFLCWRKAATATRPAERHRTSIPCGGDIERQLLAVDRDFERMGHESTIADDLPRIRAFADEKWTPELLKAADEAKAAAEEQWKRDEAARMEAEEQKRVEFNAAVDARVIAILATRINRS
jgi:hypothetical protein